MGKEQITGDQYFLFFPTMFSTFSEKNCTIWAACANSVTLEKAKILLSGKVLMLKENPVSQHVTIYNMKED